jgi:hypothetical protein
MNSVEGTEIMEIGIDEKLMDKVAETLLEIAAANGDPYQIASIIQSLIISERDAALPDTDDVATLLAFLYYFRKENGGSALYGGRRADEAIAAACRMGYIDETRLKEVFND